MLNLLGSGFAFLVNTGILVLWHTAAVLLRKSLYICLLSSLIPRARSSSLSCVDHRDMVVLFSHTLPCAWSWLFTGCSLSDQLPHL